MAWTSSYSVRDDGSTVPVWYGDNGEVSWSDPNQTQAQKYEAARANPMGAVWQSDGTDGGGGSWLNTPTSALAGQLIDAGGQQFYGNAYGSLVGSNALADRILQYDPNFSLSGEDQGDLTDYWLNKQVNGGPSHSDFGGGDTGGVTTGTAPRPEEPTRIRYLEQVASATDNPTLQAMYDQFKATPEGIAAQKLGNETAAYQQASGTLADSKGLMIPLSVGLGSMSLLGTGAFGAASPEMLAQNFATGEGLLSSGAMTGAEANALGYGAANGSWDIAGLAGTNAAEQAALNSVAIDGVVGGNGAINYGAANGSWDVLPNATSLTAPAAATVELTPEQLFEKFAQGEGMSSANAMSAIEAKTLAPSVLDKLASWVAKDPVTAAKLGITALGGVVGYLGTPKASDNPVMPPRVSDPAILEKYGSIKRADGSTTTPTAGGGGAYTPTPAAGNGSVNSQGFYSMPLAAGLDARLNRIRGTAGSPNTGLLNQKPPQAAQGLLEQAPTIQLNQVGGLLTPGQTAPWWTQLNQGRG